MEYSKKSMIRVLFIFLFYSSIAFSVDDSTQKKSHQELIQLLQKWAQDFNSKKIEEACELFAPDLVASFPGIRDENYEENCKSLRTVLTDKNKTYTYEAPLIEEVIVDQNIGIVRLVWILKVSNKENSNTEIITARSLDVFKRQQDGRWRLSISFAYPEKPKA